MSVIMKTKFIILLVGSLMLSTMTYAGVKSGFYSYHDQAVVNPYGRAQFGNVGSAEYSSGSNYASAAATGRYSVGSGMVRDDSYLALFSASQYFGLTFDGDDDFEFEDDQDDPPYLPGDPESNEKLTPIGDGWDVILLLVLLAVGYGAYVYRKRNFITL